MKMKNITIIMSLLLTNVSCNLATAPEVPKNLKERNAEQRAKYKGGVQLPTISPSQAPAGTVTPVPSSTTNVPAASNNPANPSSVPSTSAALINLKDGDVIKFIQNDLLTINASAQQKQRYFSLHVASNAGATDEDLANQRLAFKKVINSLSKKSQLVKPVAIDDQKLIYRIDLDSVNISPLDYDKIIAEHYPFTAAYKDVGSMDSVVAEQVDKTNRNLTKSSAYVVRMDWFNATAPLPILYAKFLKYPNNLSEFEVDILGKRVAVSQLPVGLVQNKLSTSLIIKEGAVDKVDKRIANILQDQALRTGFDQSNVSFSNRIVERHPIDAGSYWISYDFFNLKLGDKFVDAKGTNKTASLKDLEEHNINKTPLGPKGVNGGSLEFSHDGGEVIYSLPNGLFGYYLVNAKGTRLDKGPINVVRSNSSPPEFSLAITNGMSCMSCHNSGLLKQTDTIITGIGLNQNIQQEDEARINKMFNAKSIDQYVDEENVKYVAALKDLGIDAFKPDPVDLGFRFYNKAMSKEAFVAELDLNEREINLILVDPDFSGILNPLNNKGGFINRAVFQAILPKIIAKYKKEVGLNKPTAGDFVVTADCMALDAVKMDRCVITP